MSRNRRNTRKSGRKRISPIRFVQGLFLEALGVATLLALYVATSGALTKPLHVSRGLSMDGQISTESHEIQSRLLAGKMSYSDFISPAFQGK